MILALKLKQCLQPGSLAQEFLLAATELEADAIAPVEKILRHVDAAAVLLLETCRDPVSRILEPPKVTFVLWGSCALLRWC